MPSESDPLVAHMTGGDFSSRHNDSSSKPFKIVAIFIVIVILTTVGIALMPVTVIGPGTIGVVVTLGKVRAIESGVHFVPPFVSEVIKMSAKTQKLEETNSIPTQEGLAVSLDTVVLFHLDASKAADIYRNVGEDYKNLILEPEAASAIRGITAECDAKALYSNGRDLIQNNVKNELKQKLEDRGIIIEDVLLKDITLPSELSKAIELKAKAEQDAVTMQFVLQKESQEAQRKKIEAQGIADFQDIVSSGISPELLQWKGVEATEKFANSPNTKIIIMGNGGGDLPVILSAADSQSEAGV